MKVGIACDHAGYLLKAEIVACIVRAGHELLDLGTHSAEPVDYPDVAQTLGEALMRGTIERGVLLCGSGVGISIAANKLPGVRASVCHDTYSAHQGVEHDAMNVLTLGTRVVGPALAVELVSAFLGARFSAEERHLRRSEKLRVLEAKFMRNGSG